MARKKKAALTKETLPDVIEEVRFDERFQEDFIEFGLYAISERAVPDVRDGLKPSQRRLIFGANRLGANSKGKYMKSARIVGDVMGLLHPHSGDALYEVGVHLAQWWRGLPTLIDGEGNWGNQQGQGAAAQRYTEMRLSPFGQMFVDGLRQGVVPFKPNYSNDLMEPTVLPAPFPYLLIAGSSGILTVGISATLPPHNAREVMQTVIAYIKNPRISEAKLKELLPGPDFPTAGSVLNADEAWDYYRTGKGKFQVSGVTTPEDGKIVITEVPFTETGKVKAFQVSVDDLIFSKKILGATRARNYTNKHGVRIEVDLRRGEDSTSLESELYAKTKLQSNLNCQFIALRNGVPQVFSLRDYLSDYVAFQYEILDNRSRVEIERLSRDLEIQTGLNTALDYIDVIIELIQNTKKEEDTLKCLMTGTIPAGSFKTKKSEKIASSFSFTEAQAETILNTRLRRLNSLNRIELERKIATMQKEISRLQKIVDDPTAAKRELIKLQTEVAKVFDAPEFERKTKLTNDGFRTHTDVKRVLNFELSVDKFGYLRALPESAGAVTNEVARIPATSEEGVIFFASDGACHQIRVDKLKQSTVKDKGDTLSALGKVASTSWPLVNTVQKRGANSKLLFVTAKGLVRITNADDFGSNNTRLAGPKYKDDELVVVTPFAKETQLVLVTNSGRAKRISTKDIPELKRTGAGNMSGRLLDGEKVIAAFLGTAKSSCKIGGKSIKFTNLPLDKPSTAFKKVEV